VGGKVMDALTERPLAGAEVEIGLATNGWRRTVCTSPVGLFYFLDLPDGTYTLRAHLPGSGRRRGVATTEATVGKDANGTQHEFVFLNLRLPATVLRGTVAAKTGKDKVVMAQVRIKGSGESTYTDPDGRYVLTEIESGPRVLEVMAPGHKPVSEPVDLTGGEENLKDLKLERAAK